MKRDTSEKLSRRTALRAIGATGVAVGFGTGVGSARPDHAGRRGAENRKRERNHERNQPGHKEFDCPDDMEHLGTFEFVVEEDDDGNVVDCYFEQTEGDEELVTITDFDNKDDEECEPIVVYYESDSHEVGQISSFGGMDTHLDEEPEDGVYESDLENRGGQQAAISLLHVCGTELEEDTDDGDADDGTDDGTDDSDDDGTNGDADDGTDDSDDDGDDSDVETA